MIGVLLVVFVILDGVSRNNIAPEGAATRAVLVAGLLVAVAIWARRSGLRLPWPGAVLAGVLAGYTVAEVYQLCCGRGLSTWLIYGPIYGVQLYAKRDWQRDLAIAGIGLGALVLLAAPTGPAPGGMLNRNMIAGALLALSPAAWAWPGRTRWIAIAITVAGLAISGSRGAVLAGLVASLVYWHPWSLLGQSFKWLAAPSYGVLAVGLAAIRPVTFLRRFECAAEVMGRWAMSPVFGLGPAFEMRLAWGGDLTSNTHIAWLTPLALAGVLGVMVICLVAASLAGGRLAGQRWQWATLAGLAVHALVEENISWWPVGIVAALVLGSLFPISRIGRLYE
jgi:hypothetical protein